MGQRRLDVKTAGRNGKTVVRLAHLDRFTDRPGRVRQRPGKSPLKTKTFTPTVT